MSVLGALYPIHDLHFLIRYKTHHFTEEEIQNLLSEAGFDVMILKVEKETSSRRRNAIGNFIYLVARLNRKNFT